MSASPDEADTEIRTLLANQRFDLVMIGGAIRAFPDHTLLFEHIINAVIEAAPRNSILLQHFPPRPPSTPSTEHPHPCELRLVEMTVLG
ncbi:hypothetical protein ACQPXH_24960 [Nocardia sp. CA-135953]|uniref:hypothetical protein n=1 Tax=Nocardia sp. CA-135953 TaxID=3239978 RepID=UPI003D99CAE1